MLNGEIIETGIKNLICDDMATLFKWIWQASLPVTMPGWIMRPAQRGQRSMSVFPPELTTLARDGIKWLGGGGGEVLNSMKATTGQI